MPDLERLTADDFRPHLHERFALAPVGGESFGVELVEVAESGDGPGARRQFSLVFRGGPTPPLPQRIHALEHPQLGRLEVFLVPIGPDSYQAVFT